MTDAPRRNLVRRVAIAVSCLSALSAGCVTRQATKTVVAGDVGTTTRPSEQEAARQTDALERLKRPWLFENPDLKLRLTVPAGWAQWPLADPDGAPARHVAQFTQLWDPQAKRPPVGVAMVSIDCSPLVDDLKALARDNPGRAVEAATRRYTAAAGDVGFATGGAPPTPVQVGGRDARRLDLRRSGNARTPGVLRQVAYVTVVHDRVYVFAGTADDARAADFQGVFDRMVQGVEWTD